MKQKHIHFVGIKGVGVAPLAIIAKEAGFIVTGSDIADGFITDTILQKSGIVPFVGFESEHVVGADLVITTGAHGGYDNLEVQCAQSHAIPVLTQGEAVGAYMKGEVLDRSESIGISVGGTHGKTTTTAMVAKIFKDAGLDPSWVVGTSSIPSLGFGGHYGKGNYFIAEADEYANEPIYDKTPKMLLQHPKIAVITNIEHDHPDLYPTIASVEKAFLQFAQRVPKDGLLVVCGDDIQVQKLLEDFSGKVATYGFEEQNTFHIQDVIKSEQGTTWHVVDRDSEVSLTLSIPGEHNVLNATAAYIVAKSQGISFEKIQHSLLSFHGTKRRMEYIGQLATGATLYDDYAHHPTEIEKTIQALHEKYPNKKIVCIFQPHTYSRTKLLFEEFLTSLALADEVILSDIYPSQREDFDSTISSDMLIERLRSETKAILAKTMPDVIKYIGQKAYGADTIVLTMGAGDIYQIANQILERTS